MKRFGGQFGKDSGRSGAFSGRCRASLGRFEGIQIYLFSHMGPRSTPKGFLHPSWLDFGKVWGAFGERFGRISELSARLGQIGGLGQVGDRFGDPPAHNR